jgi:MFS family permease
LLPTYDSIGYWAPLLLALFRFGQGLGLGGEWGGAVLLATENAPAGKSSWFGMFPQLGAPLGFILSSGTFLILTNTMSNEDFLSYGWRIPFVASALLVFIGLYVRLKLSETPKFMEVIEKNEQVKVPIAEIFSRYSRVLMVGTFMAVNTFILFYLMTVFTLGWGTTVFHYSRSDFLIAQLIGVLFFGVGVVVSGRLADVVGKGKMLLWASIFSGVFGLMFPLFFVANDLVRVSFFLSLGLLIMGFTYGPLGAALAEIFPARIRYTGASTSFTLAGILGASLAPYIATDLARSYGLEWVGYYLSVASLISLIAISRMTFSAGKLGRE